MGKFQLCQAGLLAKCPEPGGINPKCRSSNWFLNFVSWSVWFSTLVLLSSPQKDNKTKKLARGRGEASLPSPLVCRRRQGVESAAYVPTHWRTDFQGRLKCTAPYVGRHLGSNSGHGGKVKTLEKRLRTLKNIYFLSSLRKNIYFNVAVF